MNGHNRHSGGLKAFSAALLCCLACAAFPAAAAGERAPVLVKTAPARAMTFVEEINADGAIAAKNHALVSPKISGTLDAVFVREGDRVERGGTRLFRVDDVKLRQALEMERQNLVLAESTLDERRAALESATADLEQAKRDFERNSSLYESKVTTLSEFERYETNMNLLRAAVKVNIAQVTLAEQSVDKAVIAVEMAEKDLDDSLVLSPVSGVVSRRFKEPGEMGVPGEPVLRIEDVSDLKAVVYLPGQFYPRVKPGASRVRVTAYGAFAGEFPVTYKSPSIDSAYRTFEIWADLPGDGEYVVPGAQCAVGVALRERAGIGVPKDAVQFRDGGHWIFLPEDGRVVMTAVTPGMDGGDYVELVDSPIGAGQSVVVQGQFLLDDGSPVRE